MPAGPFFKLKRKNGDEVILGSSFGLTVFMVILVLVVACLAMMGVNGWPELIRLAAPIR